jgi:hypothetical protein
MSKRGFDPVRLRHVLINNVKTTEILTLEEFNQNTDLILNFLGKRNSGLGIFSDDGATIFFDTAPDVTIIVKSKQFIQEEDFPQFRLKSAGAKKSINFNNFIYEELTLHWKSLVLIILIIGPFLLIQHDKEFVKELNTTIVSATAILIGVFLVFITFFYLGREHDVSYFAKGRFHTHFKNDKHIITMAFSSILFSMGSTGIAYYRFNEDINILYFLNQMTFRTFGKILVLPHQQIVAGSFTLISILLFWISFKAMTDYYFQRIKNGIYLDAISKIHEQYRSNEKE